jgi:SAM-dependent methyltransferase
VNAALQPSPYRELLLGCGNSRKKQVCPVDSPREFQNLTTLDIDADCGADVTHDLSVLPYPFADDEFDEIHAYEVLEHCGRQGDVAFFFGQFAELHRILKPGGFLIGSCPLPDSPWAWGDPGHTRVIGKESLIFLSQHTYGEQVGRTPMADYRGIWKRDFHTVFIHEDKDRWAFVLKAVK